MLNIVKGREQRPLKVVIYGPEGIGKSTFASKFPNPLFIDTEGGTRNLDVNRIKCNENWEDLLSIVKEVTENPSVCNTLVLDTADWSESLCDRFVCNKYRKENIEDFGFGKGYTYLSDEFGKLLTLLDKVIDTGINVVVTAHGKPRKYELPEEQGQFDRWEMKLSRQVAPLLKEWCDMLLFCNYKTYVVETENKSHKATGGKRVIYTSHHPCWDAKSRFELPDEIDLDFAPIAHLLKKSEKTVAEVTIVGKENEIDERLKKLMEESEVTEEELQKVVSDRKKADPDVKVADYSETLIARWIIPNWVKIVEAIQNTNKGSN